VPRRPRADAVQGAGHPSLNVNDLPIGQVAKRAGVEVQTVRYYERRGLLPPPTRRHSGQRIYASDTIDLLRAVKTAQRLGFTLLEIEEIMRLSTGKARGSNPLQDRMREKVLEIDGKIADLYAIRERLADALHAGCDSLTNCTCPACPLFAEIGKESSHHGQC
jgi:MerR family transcriptional regulator, mercuric resistance operon regulatory protein